MLQYLKENWYNKSLVTKFEYRSQIIDIQNNEKYILLEKYCEIIFFKLYLLITV